MINENADSEMYLLRLTLSNYDANTTGATQEPSSGAQENICSQFKNLTTKLINVHELNCKVKQTHRAS